MRRRTFDTLVSGVGFLLAGVLLIAGVLAFWGYSFADRNVTEQLAAQQIYFPPAGSDALPADKYPTLQQWGGEQITTGKQAEAYANVYIKSHLDATSGGKTYSQVSDAWRAGGMTDANLAQQRQTLFMGETLRGLLLNAYAFWQVGQIALIASIVAFVGAGVMLVLSILGLVHARRTPETAAI
jgi:hypothetical protein